jgi:phosphatidylserine synthase
MKKRFIIILNPVDWLTVSGIVLSLCSAALVLADQFSFALSLLFVSMLVDALDGVLARKFKLERDFGRYLDGFVDVFDYLAVPSLFLYQWGFNTWYYSLVLVIFIVAGVVRLSVFNEIGNVKDETSGLSYLGMPVFWSVLFLGFIYIIDWFFTHGALFPCVAVLYALFAFFMVYNRKFYKFKSVMVMLTMILSMSLLFALDGFGVIHPREWNPYLNSAGRHLLSGFMTGIPAIIGGSLHMLAVSKDWLSSLKIPVSEKLFGSNKTIRGFVFMMLFSVIGALILRGIIMLWSPDLTVDILAMPFWLLGIVQGFGYALFELPNSFLKRRLGIQPGESPKRFKALFILLDQLDSGIGVALATWIAFSIPVPTAAAIVILSPMVALSVKRVLFILKWKKDYK